VSLGALATLSQFRKLQDDMPMGSWRAWDAPAPKTSQRRVIEHLGTHETAIFGGNRASKTETGRVLTVAYTLGSDHPMVRRWAAANGFDLGPNGLNIPTGPGEGWAVALSSNDSLRYHRSHIDALLPRRDKRWYNFRGRGEARVYIDCPGYEKPAILWFKANDQGREAFQGAEPRVAWFDEEPKEDVWGETIIRVGPHGPPRMLLTMTPLKGLTWVYERFVATPPAGARRRVHWLHGADNPYVPTDELEAIYSQYGAHERAARERGEFVTLEGRVYEAWSRNNHVVDPFEIPADWPRFRAIDFGFRNPTCVLWGALSPDNQLVIYREHYKAGWSLRQHAERIRASEEGERINDSWADPSGKQLIVDMRREHGIRFRPARNALEAGISACAERLEGRVLIGQAACVVFSTCHHFIQEIENYVRPSEGKTNGTESPLKRNDHAMDAWRYLVMGVRGR